MEIDVSMTVPKLPRMTHILVVTDQYRVQRMSLDQVKGQIFTTVSMNAPTPFVQLITLKDVRPVACNVLQIFQELAGAQTATMSVQVQ